MSEAAASILQAALKLSDVERVQLAEALLQSMPPDEGEEEVTEQEFYAELQRRQAEYERDPSTAISWSELRKQS